MSDEQKVERVLEHVEPGRRDAVRKILIGATVYAAPVVASFSMDSLGGTAAAQVQNQTQASVPATSGWGLAGLAATMAAVGAFLARRVRDR
jgi:hypothetical protein